jgi:alpha-D-ribose 1-methylphosphonate 5-triphosphate synthase subunit PhnG
VSYGSTPKRTVPLFGQSLAVALVDGPLASANAIPPAMIQESFRVILFSRSSALGMAKASGKLGCSKQSYDDGSMTVRRAVRRRQSSADAASAFG